MNTGNISRAFVGSGEATRMYKGNVLVWEREDNWALGVNFGLVGKTDEDVPGWNNVKATESEINTGATFSDFIDYKGSERNISIEIQPSNKMDLPAGMGAGVNAPSPEAWMTAYYNVGDTGFSIIGLDDSCLYKLSIVVAGVDSGFTAQMPVSATVDGYPVYSFSSWDTDPSTDYSMVLLRLINLKPTSGELHVELSAGSGNLTLLFGVQVEEYITPKPDLMPVEMYDNSVSPVPYILSRKGNIDANTPVIISVHMGGEEGDGTIGQLVNIYPNTIFKSLVNGTYNGPTNNIMIACPQFYENENNGPLLNNFITFLETEYGISGDNVVLMGHSGGMWNALSAIGYGVHNIRAAALGASNYSVHEGSPTIEVIADKNVPMWLFADTGDPVISVAQVESVKNGLVASNPSYPVKMSVFEGGTHYTTARYTYGKRSDFPSVSSSYDMYVNGEIYSWLLNHTSEEDQEEEDVMYRLTIDVDGLTEGYNVIRNGESMPNGVIILPKDTVIDSISLSAPGYSFSPSSTTVVMDEDKTITFTATQD